MIWIELACVVGASQAAGMKGELCFLSYPPLDRGHAHPLASHPGISLSWCACRKGLGARGQAGHDAEGKGDSSSDHDLCGVQQAIEFTARALWEEYHTDQIRQPAQLLANPQLRLVHGICHYLG